MLGCHSLILRSLGIRLGSSHLECEVSKCIMIPCGLKTVLIHLLQVSHQFAFFTAVAVSICSFLLVLGVTVRGPINVIQICRMQVPNDLVCKL